MMIKSFEVYQNQTEFNFSNPQYLPRFVFGHYMKSYLSYYNDQFDNLTIINDKVQEILHNPMLMTQI